MSGSAYEKVEHANDDEFTDSEDDMRIPRASEDVRSEDRETIMAEEEAERLLGGGQDNKSGSGWFKRDGNTGSLERPRRKNKKRRKGQKKQNGGEESELMYEMEEGGPRSSSAESSGHSSEIDMQKLGEVQSSRQSNKKVFFKFTAIHIVIIAAFLALLYGAYKATNSHSNPYTNSSSTYTARTLSNGTHIFPPTTLLLSLDGFRADFLNLKLTPSLSHLRSQGLSPPYMLPSFPSLTFPNHYTLVTGLYPEAHGIVGNNFYDPALGIEFDYGDPARSMQAVWWEGGQEGKVEPLWVTAEKSGVKTAIHMWPGSEAGIGGVVVGFVDEFAQDEALGKKVERVLGWLDLPGNEDLEMLESGSGEKEKGEGKEVETRPQFIAAYVPNVDADGHRFGPNSTYICSTIAEVDGMVGALLTGLEERNLTHIVNVIVVSDHGMATTSSKRLIQLEDLLDTSTVEYIDGWPLYGLRLQNKSEARLLETYNNLHRKATSPQYHNAFEVYLRDPSPNLPSNATIPSRYHFSSNHRIAPLWLIPKTGWAIVKKEECDIHHRPSPMGTHCNQITGYRPHGLHGYDNEDALMRAIFVGRGPAFGVEGQGQGGGKVEAFQNTEVYGIVCDSLGIEPRPNNGSLRLPLWTMGRHDLGIEDGWVEVPEDLPQDGHETETGTDEDGNLNEDLSPFLAPGVPVITGLPPVKATKPGRPVAVPTKGGPNKFKKPDQTDSSALRPEIHDGAKGNEKEGKGEEPEGIDLWWEWVKERLEALKGWAAERVGGKGEKGKGG